METKVTTVEKRTTITILGDVRATGSYDAKVEIDCIIVLLLEDKKRLETFCSEYISVKKKKTFAIDELSVLIS